MNALVAAEENSEDRDGVDVTAVTKLKHAGLWAAAKLLGSQAALARHLGVDQSRLGEWMNFKRVPPPGPIEGSKVWTEENIAILEGKLLALTGLTWDEMFPEALRDGRQVLYHNRTIEKTARMRRSALEHYSMQARSRMVRNANPDAEDDHAESLRNCICSALSTLSYREREIVKMRFGLDGEGESTIREVGKHFNISAGRVHQIEAKAIRKLQQPSRAGELAEFI